MPSIINEGVLVARKQHRCTWCGNIIEKGEEYHRSTLVDGGKPYVWKSHICCKELSSFLYDYIDPCDGYTADEFSDGLREFMEVFYCPFHCKHWDKECKCCEKDAFLEMDCIKAVHEWSKTRVLQLDTSDKCPVKWAWRVKPLEKEGEGNAEAVKAV